MAESRLTNEKPKFSVAIRTETYQRLINETLGDKKTALQFIADISTVESPVSNRCEYPCKGVGIPIRAVGDISRHPVIRN